jgi:hypothetical protein
MLSEWGKELFWFRSQGSYLKYKIHYENTHGEGKKISGSGLGKNPQT